MNLHKVHVDWMWKMTHKMNFNQTGSCRKFSFCLNEFIMKEGSIGTDPLGTERVKENVG